MKRRGRNKTNVVIYQAKNGKIEFRGDFERDTIWGSINQIGELFGVQKAAVSKHMKNIFNDKELDKKTTVSILETVQMEGTRKVSRRIEYYNLDVILSVGYRVNSKQATQFRIWATRTLRRHLLEGYTINRKRIPLHYERFLRAVGDLKMGINANDFLTYVNTCPRQIGIFAKKVEGALIERMATWVDAFQFCEMFMSQSVEEQPRVAENK